MVRAKTWILVAGIVSTLAYGYVLAQPEGEELGAPPAQEEGGRVRADIARELEGTPGGPAGRRAGDRPILQASDQWQRIMEFWGQHDPRTVEHLRNIRAQRPGEFNKRLPTEWHRVADLIALQRKDPKLFKALIEHRMLSRRSQELAASMRTAKTEEERELIRKDLSENLGQIYDLQHRLWEDKIAALEQRLAELKDMLEKRAAHREEIIERRISELTGEEDYLDWEFPRWAEPGLSGLMQDEPAGRLPGVPVEEDVQ